MTATWLAERPAPAAPLNLNTPPGRHLVAIDIDGTTVRHDGSLSEKVRLAVADAQRAGHHVVIATGRSVLATMPVLEALGLHGLVVCSNGAVLAERTSADPRGFRVLATSTFDATPALELLRDSWPDAYVAVEEVGVGFKVTPGFPAHELEGRVREVDWEELLAGPATRVTFRCPTSTAEDFMGLVSRIGLHGVNYAVGFTAWLDIAAEGVSKASALEIVRRRLRVPLARTVAAGDQRNDLEMLSWAACGVAMGNAPDEVRAVADLVTGHVDDDGLADVFAALPAARPARSTRALTTRRCA